MDLRRLHGYQPSRLLRRHHRCYDDVLTTYHHLEARRQAVGCNPAWGVLPFIMGQWPEAPLVGLAAGRQVKPNRDTINTLV